MFCNVLKDLISLMFCYVLGDLIVGLEAVNTDWWRGLLDGEVGIFPLTHVTEIKTQQTSTQSTASVKPAGANGEMLSNTLKKVQFVSCDYLFVAYFSCHMSWEFYLFIFLFIAKHVVDTKLERERNEFS